MPLMPLFERRTAISENFACEVASSWLREIGTDSNPFTESELRFSVAIKLPCQIIADVVVDLQLENSRSLTFGRHCSYGS